ncbi:cbb3-type cytochrome c oxidase N-terminal domain-containing protein [Parasediminibacterium paludis]|uniref:Cbb3-type cytochrome c oxidase N-terminal domain-containing protein n=1 Tax=Parasediminibacterium paludis TaxID=908966 RepID=A0ABV8PWH0_9BACT
MQLIKKITATTIGAFATSLVMAETPSNTGSSIVMDGDTMLVICISLLAIVIAFLGNTLIFSMKSYGDKAKLKKQTETSVKAAMFIGFMLVSVSSMAQAATATTEPVAESHTSGFRILLYTIVGLEMLIIVLFAQLIKYFINPEVLFVAKAEKAPKPALINWAKIWRKLNQFKPLEHEASIDTGHSYDGIHELDNVTPPWFKVAFIASIIFAFGYLYRYQVAKSAPSQIEEYNIEVAEAKVQQEEYLKSQKDNVDENSVVMLDADGVSSGAALFKTNCVACHGAQGQGGVGPNLTDDYWLHGGGIKDVFKTIKYGWQEKGMKSWKDDFSPVQMAQLASFVKSLKGTKPPTPKDPQGDLYKEVADSTTAAAPKLADSTAAKK